MELLRLRKQSETKVYPISTARKKKMYEKNVLKDFYEKNFP